jgi:hypothetical protein
MSILVAAISGIVGVVVGGAMTMLGERAKWRRDDRITWREERRKLYLALFDSIDEAESKTRLNPGSQADFRQVKNAVDQLTLVAPEEILVGVEALARALLAGQDTTSLRVSLTDAARRDLGSAPARWEGMRRTRLFDLSHGVDSSETKQVARCAACSGALSARIVRPTGNGPPQICRCGAYAILWVEESDSQVPEPT